MNSFDRKLKKFIFGRPQTFWLRHHPDFADICLDEVSAIIQSGSHPNKFTIECTPIKDGIKVTNCSIPQIQEVILRSRTIRNAYLIVGEGKTHHLADLRTMIRKIQWDLYCHGSYGKLIIRSFRSHVYHETAIEELAISELAKAGVNQKSGQEIRLSLRENHCMLGVSVDKVPVYKRNTANVTGFAAPIKEDLAACLVINYLNTMNPNAKDLASLYNPFAGTGTLGIEAIGVINQLPGGILKNDSIKAVSPWFREASWNFSQKHLKSNPTTNQVVFLDNEESQCQAIRSRVATLDPALAFTTECEDFFKVDPWPGVIVANPPFGERLKIDNDFYSNLARKLNESQCCGFVLVPRTQAKEFLAHLKKRKVENFRFRSGGLELNQIMFDH